MLCWENHLYEPNVYILFSGSMKPGVNAILGPTGSGKTTYVCQKLSALYLLVHTHALTAKSTPPQLRTLQEYSEELCPFCYVYTFLRKLSAFSIHVLLLSCQSSWHLK